MIALFSFDDEEMLTCKFGSWYEANPQRGRANNSVVILRHKISEQDFFGLWSKIKASGSGEPGFFMTNDQEWGLNPCAEISLRPFQFCNLVTVNVSDVKNQEDLNARVRAASIIATLQASYTNFHYLREEWQETTEKEALIGVSMTGIAAGKVLDLDLEQAAKIVRTTNEQVAKIIGIKPAARATTIKPEGTSSLVLGTSSGIHAWHAKHYLRRVVLDKTQALYQYLIRAVPEVIENSILKPMTDAYVTVPVRAPVGSITRKESAMDLLGRVSKVYAAWVVGGHKSGHNKNNVSTTITIKPNEWDEVGQWMWINRDKYTALSVLPYDEHTYVQTPFEDITKEQYDSLVTRLHQIDLSQVYEDKDRTTLQAEVACGGGSCEIS
jgi:ribonucleoside-diphosphate reductase alpha chain